MSLPNQIPAWMREIHPVKQNSKSPVYVVNEKRYINRRNAKEVYPLIFDNVMDQLSSGMSLAVALSMDQRQIDVDHFRMWIMGNKERKAQYYEVREVAAEAVADTLIDIADGNDCSVELDRAKLMIETRKYMIGVWNRPRFGSAKTLDITQKNVSELNFNDIAKLIVEGEAERVDQDKELCAVEIADV